MIRVAGTEYLAIEHHVKLCRVTVHLYVEQCHQRGGRRIGRQNRCLDHETVVGGDKRFVEVYDYVLGARKGFQRISRYAEFPVPRSGVGPII